MKRINAKILPEITELKRQIGHLQGTSPVLTLIGADAGERWAQAPLEIQRQVLDALMTVTIMPQGTGGKFNPDHVVIEWK